MARKIVYVQQFDGWWALTPDEWGRCINRWFADQEWDYDLIGRRLAGPPKHAYRLRDSRSWSWSHPEHVLVQPLDWDKGDWRSAAEEAGVEIVEGDDAE